MRSDFAVVLIAALLLDTIGVRSYLFLEGGWVGLCAEELGARGAQCLSGSQAKNQKSARKEEEGGSGVSRLCCCGSGRYFSTSTLIGSLMNFYTGGVQKELTIRFNPFPLDRVGFITGLRYPAQVEIKPWRLMPLIL